MQNYQIFQDSGNYGIYVDKSSYAGILVSNFHYASCASDIAGTTRMGIVGSSNNNGRFVLNGACFFGPYVDAINWSSTQTNSEIIISNCLFDCRGGGLSQRAIGIADYGKAIISNCVFEQGFNPGNNSTAIYISPNATEIVIGNMLNGGSTAGIASKWTQNEW